MVETRIESSDREHLEASIRVGSNGRVAGHITSQQIDWARPNAAGTILPRLPDGVVPAPDENLQPAVRVLPNGRGPLQRATYQTPARPVTASGDLPLVPQSTVDGDGEHLQATVSIDSHGGITDQGAAETCPIPIRLPPVPDGIVRPPGKNFETAVRVPSHSRLPLQRAPYKSPARPPTPKAHLPIVPQGLVVGPFLERLGKYREDLETPISVYTHGGFTD
jgi:hypothetical protein